jgi:hypothetical protein
LVRATTEGESGGVGQGACLQEGIPGQRGEAGAFLVGLQRFIEGAAGRGKIAQVVQDDGHQVVRVRLSR